MTNLAFVFPGQGSQSVGMLAELAHYFPSVQDTFHRVSDKVGYDLWELVQNGPEATLNQTEVTQVAMLTADVAIYKLLQQLGMNKAALMAGHSLGEYAALVSALSMRLEDAAALVAKRGQLMQETVPMGQGGMAAIVGLTDDQVTELCLHASDSKEQVCPANFNAIGQVVIAGHLPAIHRAVKLADEQGARLAKVIPVSVPCHCPMLMDAADAFDEFLNMAKINVPEVAVISNVDLSIYKTPAQIRSLLKAQLYKPVLWVGTIQLMKNSHINTIVECGPGRVLSGLIKRIDSSLSTSSVYDKSSLEQALSLYSAHKNSSH
jgi:[acyl-carrier-protein] S-malonyltransferase